MRLVYLVTYDISDGRRLRRVFKLMRGYGDHIQYSVFRCELSDRERAELITRLADLIKHDEDQVLLFPLGPPGGIREQEVYNLGQPYTPMARAAVVI